MNIEQEPKYDAIDGKIVNRATGEAIPDDEPIFILRARDVHAADAIHSYGSRCSDIYHQQIVKNRWVDFLDFAEKHHGRMKEPDSPA